MIRSTSLPSSKPLYLSLTSSLKYSILRFKPTPSHPIRDRPRPILPSNQERVFTGRIKYGRLEEDRPYSSKILQHSRCGRADAFRGTLYSSSFYTGMQVRSVGYGWRLAGRCFLPPLNYPPASLTILATAARALYPPATTKSRPMRKSEGFGIK